MTSVLEAVELVRRSRNYRVLERFIPDPAIYIGWEGELPPECKAGLFVDVETTGLDTKTDSIIELSLVPFSFDPDGVIYDAGKGLSFFNDPKRLLAPEIVEITGITDDMVRGQSIDTAAVRALADSAVLVVAHNADFDRKFMERAMPFFREKPWACSYREVPWETLFGCRVSKLPIILSDACGQFSDEHHRALEDCHAGVSVLANAKVEGRTALSFLLESARQPTHRVWAIGSPFGAKDKLRARGYHWDGEGRKAWFRDVRPADVDEELMYARDVGGARPEVSKFSAKDRYSVRVA